MQAVLFDLDGTLLNTLRDIRNSVNGALKEFGYPAITEDETRRFVGDGAYELMRRAVPENGDVDGCFAAFERIFAANDGGETAPYEGARECLAALKKRGIKLAVVTNKPQYATEKLVEKFFPDTFDFVAGDSGLFPCKPDPTLARYCALSLRVPMGECVFVGDGETDVLTAKNAGMKGIAVLWGYRGREELERAGATDFAENYSALEKMLANA